jgi:hypothetical protein
MAKSDHGDTASLVYDDEFITVGMSGFDPGTGEVRLKISENQPGVGMYNITVKFLSGNSATISYDGAVAEQPDEHLATTPRPNDAVEKITVVCARPSRKVRPR